MDLTSRSFGLHVDVAPVFVDLQILNLIKPTLPKCAIQLTLDKVIITRAHHDIIKNQTVITTIKRTRYPELCGVKIREWVPSSKSNFGKIKKCRKLKKNRYHPYSKNDLKLIE